MFPLRSLLKFILVSYSHAAMISHSRDNLLNRIYNKKAADTFSNEREVLKKKRQSITFLLY